MRFWFRAKRDYFYPKNRNSNGEEDLSFFLSFFNREKNCKYNIVRYWKKKILHEIEEEYFEAMIFGENSDVRPDIYIIDIIVV